MSQFCLVSVSYYVPLVYVHVFTSLFLRSVHSFFLFLSFLSNIHNSILYSREKRNNTITFILRSSYFLNRFHNLRVNAININGFIFETPPMSRKIIDQSRSDDLLVLYKYQEHQGSCQSDHGIQLRHCLLWGWRKGYQQSCFQKVHM